MITIYLTGVMNLIYALVFNVCMRESSVAELCFRKLKTI